MTALRPAPKVTWFAHTTLTLTRAITVGEHAGSAVLRWELFGNGKDAATIEVYYGGRSIFSQVGSLFDRGVTDIDDPTWYPTFALLVSDLVESHADELAAPALRPATPARKAKPKVKGKPKANRKPQSEPPAEPAATPEGGCP